MGSYREVIGLLPAAGQAARLGPLPMSKEVYPLGFHLSGDGMKGRPKVVGHYLLEKMRFAEITKAYIVLRSGKWDIPAYFGDGAMLDMNLAYLIMRLPFGVPYTLDQAYPFIQQAVVAMGFPDTLFEPHDAFLQLLARQAATDADVVLGLFPTDQPHKVGMVDVDNTGRVQLVVEKPGATELRYAWGIAVWTPVFTHFMHEYLIALETKTELTSELNAQRNLPIGDVIQAAVHNGLRVEAETFPDGKYLDIGTPEDLAKAIQLLSHL
jgi:glucose-1-phosphate thymidylyltransferase